MVFRALVLGTLLILAGAATAERRLNARIPDFTQTEIRGAGHGNGQQFCAPAAVSNSLFWLAPRGLAQQDLVKLLASEAYMKTSLKDGTGTSGVLRGVHRYATETFGEYQSLLYQGWRKHPATFSTGIRVPTLSFIERGVTRRSAAWLNVGWYRLDRTRREYRRVGGHWVTLVGFDFVKNQLIISDPAPRATPGHEYISYRRLAGGRLVGKKSGLPTNAEGYLQLGRGIHLHPKAETAIIDGVVLFEL